MTSFELAVLDDADALLSADRGGLLRALAAAGAQVRRAEAMAGESGIDRLRDSQRPRAVLVAADPDAPYLPSLLAAVGAGGAPVLDWRDPVLPRWAGPADALLVTSADGRHAGIAELVAQADRRGLVLAVAAPAGSPVAAAAARHPIADLSYLASVPPRSVWWALATPALLALDALGLASTGPLLSQLADCLDEIAEANRPDSSAYSGPAKLLAAELAESVPVIAGIGHCGVVAAQRVAGSVQLIGGFTAMAASLPDDVARIGSLLEFAAAEQDFFADRVTEASVRPRLVLVGDDDRYDEHDADDGGRRAGAALAGLAVSRGIGCSRILVPAAPALVRFAAATATGDFAATYLALARGVDPSAPRLGELPH